VRGRPQQAQGPAAGAAADWRPIARLARDVNDSASANDLARPEITKRSSPWSSALSRSRSRAR
jgi:hypothetical protein